mgnify:CR=1 FL=1
MVIHVNNGCLLPTWRLIDMYWWYQCIDPALGPEIRNLLIFTYFWNDCFKLEICISVEDFCVRWYTSFWKQCSITLPACYPILIRWCCKFWYCLSWVWACETCLITSGGCCAFQHSKITSWIYKSKVKLMVIIEILKPIE